MSRHSQTQFGAFDPTSELSIRKRNLPHWFQANTAVFITFRTADSLPREVVLRMRRELEEWLRARTLPLHLARVDNDQVAELWRDLPSQPDPAELEKFRKQRALILHRSLDDCHGACHLRRKDLQNRVADSLLYFSGRKYELDCFVVMPNHVHVLAQFHSSSDSRLIGQSWMRYSARKINEILESKGQFWQAEPFDHLVRSEEQFRYLQGYVNDNPARANLNEGEWLLWNRE